MKLKRPAFIVMTLIILSSVGCDEAAMVDDIVINGLTEEAGEPILRQGNKYLWFWDLTRFALRRQT